MAGFGRGMAAALSHFYLTGAAVDQSMI